MSGDALWARFKQCYVHDEDLGFALDASRMNFDEGWLEGMRPAMDRAFEAMDALENGAIANPDENRMVGHYWLRAPGLAPTAEITESITATIEAVRAFAERVHRGEVLGGQGETFTQYLLVGIGGSALGPQLAADALCTSKDRMRFWFLDNTDPDGIRRTLDLIETRLDRTLVIVISKSGGTAETRNGMLEAQARYERIGLNFAQHAVAITSEASKLHRLAQEHNWLATFPMWDWVGGRTSLMSAVGLLPAALQGLDIDGLLAGARAMDEWTRKPDPTANPAALLALMWHWAGNGRGEKDMVILPYRDRLVLFSKYLQQLVMESLGKERSLAGEVVNQGIAVYGNKGSTDQHAYVQQLREGVNNFFATFIEVLDDDAGSGRPPEPLPVEKGATSGDFLHGFLLGTRAALHEKGRESLTITVRRLNAQSLGMLIALYERAVGLYAGLVNINAYHQPGVEAGKKAAAAILDLQRRLHDAMHDADQARTAEQWAEAIGRADEVETVFKLLERLAANNDRGIERTPGATPFEARYRRTP